MPPLFALLADPAKYDAYSFQLGIAKTDDGGGVCLVCGKRFTAFRNCKAHYAEKHEEASGEIFRCHICGKEFTIARYRSVHLSTIHGISAKMLKASSVPQSRPVRWRNVPLPQPPAFEPEHPEPE